MRFAEAQPHLRAESLRDILETLRDFNSKREHTKDYLFVKALLAGGHRVLGAPLDISQDSFTLFLLDDGDILYLDCSAIQALQFPSSALAFELLTSGRFFQPPPEKTPSLLALKRSFKQAQEQLFNEFGIVLRCELFHSALSDGAKFNLDQFLKSLLHTLQTISADDDGQVALSALREIHIEAQAQYSSTTAKASYGLLVQLNLNQNLTPYLENLQSAIEEQI